MKNNGSPKPYFETDDERSSFLIRLPIHRSFLNEFEEVQSINQAGITTEQVEGTTEQVAGITEQVAKLLVSLQEKELGTKALLDILNLSHRPTFLHNYLQPALDAQLVEMTQPESPRSPTQKYRLTLKGAKYSKRLS